MEGSASNEWITAFGGSWWSMCPTRLLTSAVPFQTYEDARWDAVAREQRRLDRNLTDRRGSIHAEERRAIWSVEPDNCCDEDGVTRCFTPPSPVEAIRGNRPVAGFSRLDPTWQ